MMPGRHWPAVAAFFVLLFSQAALAVGLGEISVHSALNQPFDAAIELTGVDGARESDIRPGLASEEDFGRLGVIRDPGLPDLRFKVITVNDGSRYVHVTSRQPVVEPFLSFVVQVPWPTGRILKEYTVLLDPQGFRSRGAHKVDPGKEYGVTGHGDRLWRIALMVRPDESVSVQQTMLALVRANPDAFTDGNVNLLKAGEVLRIPGHGDIRVHTVEGAVAEVRGHNEAFAAYKRDGALGSGDGAGAASAGRDGELRLLAADQAGGAGAGEDAGGASASGGELAVVREDLDRVRRENTELKARLDDLAGQMETLNETLKLKDEQLAALLAELKQQRERAGEQTQERGEQTREPAQEAAQEPTQEPAQEPAQDKGDNPSTFIALRSELEEMLSEFGEWSGEKFDELRAELDERLDELPSEFDEQYEKLLSKLERAQRRSDNPWELTVETVEALMSNALGLSILGTFVAIVIIIVMMLRRRSRRRADIRAARQASRVTSSQGNDRSRAGSGGGQGAEKMAPITPEPVEAAPIRARDIVSDVEIDIAYGRFDKAINALQAAMEMEPARADIHLKLLEIYTQTGDEAAFDRQLEQLRLLGDEGAISEALELLRSRVAGSSAGASVAGVAGVEGADEGEPVVSAGAHDDVDFEEEEPAVKLGLARAYIEMGDVDGAKALLGEVLARGTEKDIAEANELLGKLN